MKRTLLFILIYVFVSACNSDDQQGNDDRTVFKYNDMSGVNSLDPAAARDFENILAINQLFNGLVEMNDSLRIKPSIAKSWKISEDGIQNLLESNYCFEILDISAISDKLLDFLQNYPKIRCFILAP